MKVDMIKFPTDEDWRFCRKAALETEGKDSNSIPSYEWKERILRSEHSPIRCLWFAFEMEIPYWVSVHFVRHNNGVQHFVQSQRDDRANNDVPRAEKAQGETVKHLMVINAQALINMCHVRLCNKASKETNAVMWKIRQLVLSECPEFSSVLVPNCVYKAGRCDEFKPCGYAAKYMTARDAEEDDLK